MSIVLIFLLAVFIILFGGIIWSVLKHSLKLSFALLANTILGFIAMVFLNFLGFGIPINIVTIIVVAVFGLLGVAVIAVLSLFGML